MTSITVKPPTAARWGWGILLALSALLVLHGATWFFQGPEVALANIAERTSLTAEAFRLGDVSAFAVITLITRNSSVYEVALGLMAFFVAWHGFGHGQRWAWNLTWVLVAALSALALAFVLAGGIGGASAGYLVVAALALAGQLLAGRGR